MRVERSEYGNTWIWASARDDAVQHASYMRWLGDYLSAPRKDGTA